MEYDTSHKWMHAYMWETHVWSSKELRNYSTERAEMLFPSLKSIKAQLAQIVVCGGTHSGDGDG